MNHVLHMNSGQTISRFKEKKIKIEDVVKVIKFKMIMNNYLLYISL